MIRFNNKDIKVAIFDLDGTLIDSTSIWSEIDRLFFSKRGVDIPADYGKAIAHLGLDKAATYTRDHYFPDEKEEDIKKEWNDLALYEYKEKIELKDNVLEVLKYLKENNVKIALATANSKELYTPCMERLQIAEYFDFIIDVNSCKNGKNTPEIFDRVIEHFGVKREEAIIFEDTLTAIKTGFLANYNVIGIYDKQSTYSEEENKKYSHLFIHDFKEFVNRD